MKQILIGFFSLILISNKVISQQNLQVTRLNNSCDTLVVRTSVWFSFGFQSTCPQLANYETVSNSDTMELNLYYNVSGAWPQVGCEKLDTIISKILPNVSILKCVAYSVNDNDTAFESSTQIQICSLTGIEKINNDSFSLIFPNPFSTQLNVQYIGNEQTTISIYDFVGQQIIISKKFTNTTAINVEQLAEGIYFYEIRNEKGLIKNGKVLKQ